MFRDLLINTNNDLPAPLYLQIKDQLEKYILDNNIAKDTKLPDIQTLSDLASVSIGTMGHALKALVEDGVCYSRPKKGTFVGQVEEKHYKGRVKKVCGVLHSQEKLSFEDDVLLLSIYKGIQRLAHQEDIDVIMLTENSLTFYESLEGIDLLGVILLQWRNADSLLRLATNHPQQNFLALNYCLSEFDKMPDNIKGIFNSDFAGSFEAVTALYKRGHRNFALVSVPISDNTYHEREQGALHALADCGISSSGVLFIDEKMYDPSVKEQREAGMRLAEQVVSQRCDISAIVCVNDYLAAGVVDYLDANGLRNKVEVVGYDNLWQLSKDMFFSTISINFELMGSKAVQVLTNKDIKYPKQLTVAPSLLPRWNVELKQEKTATALACV